MRARRVLAAVAAGVWLAAAACAPAAGREVRLTIRKGSSFREAADSLAAHGMVRSGRVFALYARLRRKDRSLRWGTYVLRQGMSWEQALDALRAGRGIVHTLTIPEGYPISQIAPLLADALDLPNDSILAAVRDTSLLHRLDVPTPTLEGYLFPDTYVFADGTTAREAVRTMVERFEHEWKPEWNDRLREVAMNRHDIVTLASIVEMEVRRGEERPVVAAVYLNRLRVGMQLQADPTVQYALGKKPGRVYFRDLRVNSPYNTYKVSGLPPGPIASPGAASLRASLYPAKVPYRYFVAHPDGHHEFRRTYAEHVEAIKLVRAAAAALAADSVRRAQAAADSLRRATAPRDSTRP
jgi:UPF0755 protein